MMHQSNTREMR